MLIHKLYSFILLLTCLWLVPQTGFAADDVRGNNVNLNGTSDYISVPYTFDPSATSFTLETWVRIDQLTGRNPIFAQLDGTGTGRELLYVNSSGALVSDLGGTSSLSAPDIVQTDIWQHVAIVYDGTVLRLYLNGKEALATLETAATNDAGLNIGANKTLSDFLDGQVEETRIWSRTLTGDEIREQMHLTQNGMESGLEVYYQYNTGTGTTISDAQTNVTPARDGTFIGAPTWSASTANVGDDGSLSVAETTNVPSGSSVQTFGTANLRMNFTSHVSIENVTVTYQNYTPNTIAGVDGYNAYQTPMWTINSASEAITFLADVDFIYPSGTFGNTIDTKYELYWRPIGSGQDWARILQPLEIIDDTVTVQFIERGGQFMLVQQSIDIISDERKQNLRLDGNGWADLNSTLLPASGASPISISCWIKSDGNNGTIISQGDGSATDWFTLRIQGGVLEYVRDNAGIVATSTTPINDNALHHIAVTRDGAGNVELYVDGMREGIGTDVDDFASDLTVIGNRGNTNLDNPLIADIEEVRFWTVDRTLIELRENMHLTLKGGETGLQAYYQFDYDEPAGTTDGVKDGSGNAYDGTIDGLSGTVYPLSPVPVGGGVSDTRGLTTSSTLVTFDETDVTIDFSSSPSTNTEIVVSRIETQRPTGFSSSFEDIDDQYFIVREYGGASFTVSEMQFGRMAYISATDGGDPSVFELYKRPSNAMGDTWGTPTAVATNVTTGSNGELSFTSLGITSFSQFVIVNTADNSLLPTELLYFEAERSDELEVQLDWATAAEQGSDYFDVQRMLDDEDAFRNIGKVEAAGNSSRTREYAYTDFNASSQGAYYRIKQVGEDGSETYSDVRYISAHTITEVGIFPNPTADVLQVRLSGQQETLNVEVEVVNTRGRVLLQQQRQIQPEQILRLEEVAELAAGSYYLYLRWGETGQSFPFVKR